MLNREIIDVDQDALGIQGRRVTIVDDIEIWTRKILPLNYEGRHSYAVAFVSRYVFSRYFTELSYKKILHLFPDA